MGDNNPAKITPVERTLSGEESALTMDDLEQNTAYLDAIRAYMIDRKGKHFLTKNPEEVVDAFTRHMRFFNVNESCTIR